MTTEALQHVDAGSKSVLPTGRLKFENGVLYQEALVIRHRPSDQRGVGYANEWLPVPEEFVVFIQNSKPVS